MTEKLKQTIEEQIAKIPKEMQRAVGSFNWINITEEIGREHTMDDNAIEAYQLETLLVLIGVVDLDSYAINIEKQVGTTKNNAEALAKEGVEKIFLPLREKVETEIKKNLPGQSPGWKQNLNFIMSGGNYLALLKDPSERD